LSFERNYGELCLAVSVMMYISVITKDFEHELHQQ